MSFAKLVSRGHSAYVALSRTERENCRISIHHSYASVSFFSRILDAALGLRRDGGLAKPLEFTVSRLALSATKYVIFRCELMRIYV
jgi:hypothetical protein